MEEIMLLCWHIFTYVMSYGFVLSLAFGSRNWQIWPALYLFLQIQCYWNTSRAIPLLIVHGYFHTKAELNSCDRDHRNYKIRNIYCLTLYRKRLLIPF